MKQLSLNVRMVSYFEIFLKQAFAFRMEALANAAFNAAFPVVMIIVWTAVFYTSGATTISGFTLPELYVYFFALTISDAFLMYGVSWSMEYDVNSGYIYTYLTKPLSYMAATLAGQLSSLVFYLLTAGLVVFLVFALFVKVAVAPIMLVFYACDLLIALVLSFNIMFMLGCVAFWTPSIEGMIDVGQFAMVFLGGGLVPIAMFPQWASSIMYLLPFQYFYSLPATTLAGLVTAQQALPALAVGIGWAALTTAMCLYVWNRAKLRMDAVGV